MFNIFYYLLQCFRNMFKKNVKILISIEGNIGVGKTTLMNLLEESLGDTAEYIFEPINEWHNIKDCQGRDILQTFYDDKLRWSYTFQNFAYITKLVHIINKIENSGKKYIIMDRSLAADINTFGKMLHEDGFMNDIEWNAYKTWNNFFENFFGTL